MLKLVIRDQTDYGMMFKDFLCVELCRGRIIEEQHYKAKGVGMESFQVMKSLLSSLPDHK